jgi:hypothetical protein
MMLVALSKGYEAQHPTYYRGTDDCLHNQVNFTGRVLVPSQQGDPQHARVWKENFSENVTNRTSAASQHVVRCSTVLRRFWLFLLKQDLARATSLGQLAKFESHASSLGGSRVNPVVLEWIYQTSPKTKEKRFFWVLPQMSSFH